jgi:hypothetical protein
MDWPNNEQQRHVRENLTEEELTVFDILTHPGPDLSAEERGEIKKVAHILLERWRPFWRWTGESVSMRGLAFSWQSKISSTMVFLGQNYVGSGVSVYTSAAWSPPGRQSGWEVLREVPGWGSSGFLGYWNPIGSKLYFMRFPMFLQAAQELPHWCKERLFLWGFERKETSTLARHSILPYLIKQGAIHPVFETLRELLPWPVSCYVPPLAAQDRYAIAYFFPIQI